MGFRFTEMISLQDVRVSEHTTAKEITPTKFYALLSCALISLGVYVIALLFSKVATSALGLATADLLVQANLIFFVFITLIILFFPWMKMQRYRIDIMGEQTQLFQFQEAIVALFGILFFNIPIMFLAHAVALQQKILYLESLNAEVLHYIQSSYAFQMPTLQDVVICALFGIGLLILKVMVFLRVARRFVQNKRYRNVVR